jgi:hypothetical protein
MIKFYLLTLAIILTCTSCKDSDEKITQVESSGRINHLLVVMEDDLWQGEVGDSLRSIIGEPVVGLPQEEAQFTVTQTEPKAFSYLFKRTRNVLYIDFDQKDNSYTSRNVYAAPQTIFTILGKDTGSLLKQIDVNKRAIIDVYKTQDLALYQKNVTSKHWNRKNIATMKKIGFRLKIPVTYDKVTDTGDFLWYRYTFPNGMLNLIAYAIPLTDKSDFTKENIIRVRDSIGKLKIPGQFKNTYMTTELQVYPVFKRLNFKGTEAYETRGLWYVENDFMGGPFISYSFYDAPRNRMIVAEGFSYSPATKKRDFVFEMEAILKTMELNE